MGYLQPVRLTYRASSLLQSLWGCSNSPFLSKAVEEVLQISMYQPRTMWCSGSTSDSPPPTCKLCS